MNPLLNIAFRAARSASKIIVGALDHLDKISIAEKSHNDYVTEVDKKSEQEIINVIHASYPNHAILGEEGGKIGEDDHVWIIDPLDGTLNYIHGLPHFSISIAVKYKNKIEHGLIYDPLRNEIFMASRGEGCYFNHRRMRVSKQTQFDKAMLGTAYSHSNPDNFKHYLATLSTIEMQTSGIRRGGSAALDLAYVAAGRFDGLWEFNLKPWDMAAGALMIEEAGGIISDLEGKRNYLETGNIIAGNRKIFKALLQNIQRCLKNS